MSSIRLRLLKWLIGPILLINLAGASLTYMLAWIPAQLAFDEDLAVSSGALAARLRAVPAGAWIDLPRDAEQVLRANEVDAFYFVVRDASGRLLAGVEHLAVAEVPGARDHRRFALASST